MILLALLLQTATPLPICEKGYAAAQRPAWVLTAPIKRRMLRGRKSSLYILDHTMPIELGGAPLDPANMQLQTKAAAHRKDLVENRLHRAVCSGKITLDEAQAKMRLWR